MKKILVRALCALALLACSPAAKADDDADQTLNVLHISRADGESEYLMLDPDLIIRFLPDAILLVHPEVTVEYPLDDLSKFIYEYMENPVVYDGTHESARDALQQLGLQTGVVITRSEITVSGVDSLSLYDLQGREQVRATGTDGCVTIQTASLPAGVYILRAGDLTLKVRI